MEPNYLPFASLKENECHMESRFLLELWSGSKKMAGWIRTWC